ncbi:MULTISPECIES: NlpC/P60 family protein [unclassified Microbispora]|uniref:NlpC/P60 family protein n=1 Tax=unclassified Microbispora TaxID=2614687 RepID=UPI003216A4EF
MTAYRSGPSSDRFCLVRPQQEHDRLAPESIHHVGLYIGEGKTIHAPHTGSHVQIAPMFRSDYVGAVRLS